MRRVRKIPNRLQTDHGGDLIAVGFTPARVNETSHFRRSENERLLVHEGNEAQGARTDFPAKRRASASSAATPLPLSFAPGEPNDRIIMRADDNDFGMSAANFRLDIVEALSAHFVTCPVADADPAAEKDLSIKSAAAIELRITLQVPFADISGESLHIGDEFGAQRNLLRG